MEKSERVLQKNLNANRSRKIVNVDYFERFKKHNPVTYRRVIKSMEEYGDWRVKTALKQKKS